METKASIKRRLQEDGRWAEFVEYRERLKREGMPTPEAWLTAAAEFPEQGMADGRQHTKSVPVEESRNQNASTIPPIPPPLEGISTGVPKRTPVEYGKGSMARTSVVVAPVSREQFSGKKPRSMRERIEWVWGNIGITDISAADAPDSQSWFLLDWARSPAGKVEFYRSFVARLLPNKNSMEDEEKFFDDGRAVLENIERVERESRNAVLPLSPQGPQGEPQVSS